MKLSCNVIRDLLLLYENEECSHETKALVEEHLAECPECDRYRKNMYEVDDAAKIPYVEECEETKIVKKGLRKIKKRWMISLIAALLIIPLCVVGKMTYNESQGYGICFTNLDDIHVAKKFMKHIKNGKLEEAVDMIDYMESYRGLITSTHNQNNARIKEIFGDNPTIEEFTKIRRGQYLSYLEEFEQKGYQIKELHYSHEAVWYESDEEWTINITFTEIAQNGTEIRDTIAFRVNKEGKLEPAGSVGTTFSALQYALHFNNMWNLDETPSYEEYSEMDLEM